MTVISKDLEPVHFLEKDSLGRIPMLLTELVTKIECHEDQTSYWQAIFAQSKANGSAYRGEDLPHSKWHWPKDTWFREELRRSAMRCA
jgi:hypothetical protein